MKKNLTQEMLNEELSYYAETGDVAGMKDKLAEGADLFYHCADLNVLDKAVINNRLESVKFLLEHGFADRPQYVGKAMKYVKDSEIFRCLASSRLDCAQDVYKGLTLFDYLFCKRNYAMIGLYRQCGLAQPPLNPKVMRGLKTRCDLNAWEIYTEISIPDQYRRDWEAISSSDLYNKEKKRKKFKKLLAEVLSNSQAGERAFPSGHQ